MSSIPDKSGDLSAYAARCFPCSFRVSDIFAKAFSQLPPPRRPPVRPLFGQCPFCSNWLAARRLIIPQGPSNVFGFSSQYFCPACLFEKYSFDVIHSDNSISITRENIGLWI